MIINNYGMVRILFKFIEQFYLFTKKTSRYETKIFTFLISYRCFS